MVHGPSMMMMRRRIGIILHAFFSFFGTVHARPAVCLSVGSSPSTS